MRLYDLSIDTYFVPNFALAVEALDTESIDSLRHYSPTFFSV